MKGIIVWIRNLGMESMCGRMAGFIREIFSKIFVMGMGNFSIEISLFSEVNGEKVKKFYRNNPTML